MQFNIKAFLVSILLSRTEAFAPFQRLGNNPVATHYKSQSAQYVSTFPEKTESEVLEESQKENLADTVNSLEDTSTKSYLDDGFIFGLEGSGIERPKGKVSQIVVEGDSTETKPYQVAMVLSTFAFHMSLIGINSVELFSSNGGNMITTVAQIAAVISASWTIADFGSGVLHWSVDNYGNGRTPIMGNIIAAFQGHHAAPWTITERGFCNNVYKLCVPFGIPTMTLINFLLGPSGKIHIFSD